MIWNEELPASLDQVAGVVVLQQVELSHLQRLALQLVDKASQLADGSERYLDAKLSQGEQRADGVRGEGGQGGQRGERRGNGAGRGRGQGRGRGGASNRFNQGSLGRTVNVQ
jgi:translation initiation factor 3 subunit C